MTTEEKQVVASVLGWGSFAAAALGALFMLSAVVGPEWVAVGLSIIAAAAAIASNVVEKPASNAAGKED